MKSIDEILKELKRNNPLLSRLPDVDIEELWEKAMDDTIKKIASVDKFENGCLFIVVKDSVWLAELTLLKGKIIEKLNALHKGNIFKEIRLKAGPVKYKMKDKASTSIFKPVTLPSDVEMNLGKILQKVEDEKLKKVLENIFRKSYYFSQKK